eukprot:CAMPEP_0174289832 /NCGR_PEP_ID=MMETSP0809-20121228/26546_1 /TAXON_ID=73025 ORGANISM="Eutreptiella gymnastica-like, Strain CCMP1594" /NCGR_SAMPLE_ID=MMETSP0809 /ASSEMBLY_ACC=CAM_ASM_000658 /LENGTH=54 /DNA_ID=CAMNT_0015388049 /DNA_START=1950 /DNA_END=2114 /DNA_ORIENTATION=+
MSVEGAVEYDLKPLVPLLAAWHGVALTTVLNMPLYFPNSSTMSVEGLVEYDLKP